jgi:putative transposase
VHTKLTYRKEREPVSTRLGEAYARVRALHGKVARQRHDFLHQITADLVRRHGAIAVEELNIRGMSAHGGARKTDLNRGILDAAGGAFHRRLSYKAVEAGSWVMEAPTRTLAPSQTCHACGHREKTLLAQRWHDCRCGASCSRDENSGRVLLHWLEEKLQTVRN